LHNFHKTFAGCICVCVRDLWIWEARNAKKVETEITKRGKNYANQFVQSFDWKFRNLLLCRLLALLCDANSVHLLPEKKRDVVVSPPR